MSAAIARRYARAVFDLGREATDANSSLDRLVADLSRFADAYRASAELREIDRLPKLSESDRRSVIDELGKRLSASATAVRTVTMLAERQRLSLLPDIASLLGEMHDDHTGIVRARVKSARKLSEDYLCRLSERIGAATGKKVVITTEEDPSLIAGVVAEIGDRVIDGSVRGRLDRLNDSLRQN
jgi:F-type H+-transporting ATPase subunit delta